MLKCDFNKVTLKSHFGMGALVQICRIFSEHLFPRPPLVGCFCKFTKIYVMNCSSLAISQMFSNQEEANIKILPSQWNYCG